MGLLSWARRALAPQQQWTHDDPGKERRLRLTDGGSWSLLFGRSSYAGRTVTVDSALQLSTVWACISRTVQAVSCLPLAVYEKQASGGRDQVDDDEVAQVIGSGGSPNADQTPLEFWETMVAGLMCQGNAYAEIVRTGPRLSALEPFLLAACVPARKPDGALVYRVTDRGKTEELPADKVFHLKGFGQNLRNPDLGLSPIAYGAHSLGAGMAAEEAAGSLFANGARPSAVLMFDKILSKDQRHDIRENVVKPISGSDKAGGIFVLEAGMKYETISINPDDAQLLETRRFTVEDICRWFGVPPIIIGHAGEGQTMWGTGVEQLLLSWLTLGIDPLCDRIEARIRKSLIRPTGNRRRYAEFNREALLQMDSAAKASFLSTMVQNGLMDRNEGRAKLNLSARPEAGRLTAQTNLAPLDSLGAGAEGAQVRAALRAFLGVGDEQKDRKA